MTLRRLRQPFKSLRYGDRDARLPVVAARLLLGNLSTRPLDAVLDTSSPWTLASMELAFRLGYDRPSILGSGDVIEFPAVTHTAQAWGHPIDLVLGTGPARIALESVTIHFADALPGPFDLRLGQEGVLDELLFMQFEASFELEWED